MTNYVAIKTIEWELCLLSKMSKCFSWWNMIMRKFKCQTLTIIITLRRLTMACPGVSVASILSPLLRLGVSTFSRSKLYWRAQFFWENQSWGRPSSEKGFIWRDTDTQFWSPDLSTAEARPNCSRRLQTSMGVCFSIRRCWAPAGVVVVDVEEGPGDEETGVPGVVNIF